MSEQLDQITSLDLAIKETREILLTSEPQLLSAEELDGINELCDALILSLESNCLDMFVDLFTQLHDMIVALDDGIFAQFIACLVQIKNPNLLGRELTSIQNFHIEGAESILLCLVDEFIDEDDDGFDEFLEAEDLTPSEATQTDATIIEDGLAVVVTEGVE